MDEELGGYKELDRHEELVWHKMYDLDILWVFEAKW